MRIVSSLLLFCTALFAQDYGYIVPPQGWKLANPEKSTGRVKVAFLKPSGKELPAHINLAVEEGVSSLSGYVAEVKKIHEADPTNRWRDLGKFQTPAGEARLTELETKSQWGEVRQLQLLFVKNRVAYIITASAPREEFSKFYQDVQYAFRSLNVTSDLIDSLPKLEKRAALKQLCKNLKKENWVEFQDKIIHDFADLGPYWQALMLQSQQEKLK